MPDTGQPTPRASWLAHIISILRHCIVAFLALARRLSADIRAQVARLIARLDEGELRHRREALLARWQDAYSEWGRALQRGWAGGLWQRLTARYTKRQLQRATLAILVLLVVLCGPLSVIVGLRVSQLFGASSSTPNLFDPTTAASSVPARSPFPTGSDPNWRQPPSPQPILRHVPLPMKDGLLPLHAGQTANFVGSDGALEVDVPSDAVTSADVSAAGGALNLKVRQLAPPSGSNAGGSGHVSLGTYLLEVVDGNGNTVANALRTPVTLKYHYGGSTNTSFDAFDLTHVLAVFNGMHPSDVQLSPPRTGVATPQLGSPSVVVASLQPASAPAAGAVSAALTPAGAARTAQSGTAAHQRSSNPATGGNSGTLVVTAGMSSPSTSVSWDTFSPVATFGKPDPFNTDLSAGGLSAGFAIDVPSGPGGLTPPVNLGYSSAAVSEQHSLQGAAPWVGEGWSMGLGSISWAEHNVIPPGGMPEWQSSWQLSDPFGTGAELIPPNLATATYYDDTNNTYFDGTNYPGTPVTWHTAPESHVKVISYVGPLTLDGMAARPPCFRAWLTNGIMEEFGCTTDSLEFYTTSNNGDRDMISSWNLDLITDPSGNQIHITYQRDMELGQHNHSYPRAAELATIEYDSPGCRDAQNACTGANWNPLVRIYFGAAHVPLRLTNTPSGCNTGANLRCDDPLDLTGSGGMGAPAVQSNFALNDILVQTRGSGGASWNNLRDYQLSYEQTGPTTTIDPVTGQQESAAGAFDLTLLREVGTDGTTAQPTSTFVYNSYDEFYEDSAQVPASNAGCGAAWNTGQNSICPLWSTTSGGNDRYMTAETNGLGLLQTFAWMDGRNNTHGVNGGGPNTANPVYCNTLAPSAQATYPCNEADDQNWSRTILTAESSQVLRVWQAGQGGQQSSTPITGTTTYSFQLTWPLAEQECPDCVAGMYWGDQNDGDVLDYYNGKFMGFTETGVSHPDGSVDIHKYYATSGYGLYDNPTPTGEVVCYSPYTCHASPWWIVGNAAHGHEYEMDSYDTNGTTLLAKSTTTYSLTCPPSGVSGTGGTYGVGWGDFKGNLVSQLDDNNPVAACDIQTQQTDSYNQDGATVGTAVPHATTSYTYDSYGRVTATTKSTNDGGATGSPTTIVNKTTYIWNDAVSATSTSASGTYLVDTPALATTEDSGATTRYACTYTSYDGAGYAVGQQSSLSRGLATTKDTYASCGTAGNGFQVSGLIRTTTGYDVYGNALTTNDADANGGDSRHTASTGPCVGHSSCTGYDATFAVLPLTATNALNQTTTTAYGASTDPSVGYGWWPVSVTDANSQTTYTSYDALGRATATALPGETQGLNTTSASYTVWCSSSTTSGQAPCAEQDATQRLDNNNTTTTRSFFDGDGRLVEQRSSAPGGQDVVRYRYFDPSGRVVFESIPYFVAAYTGAPGASAYSLPDSTVAGTTTTYDGLGRPLTTTDALSHITQQTYLAANWAPGDSSYYSLARTVDPNSHLREVWTDAWGRQVYAMTYSGNSFGNYGLYAKTSYGYDFNGNQTKIVAPDGTTQTSFTYDAAGRKTGMSDPDRGSESYTYDPDGNKTQQVDARGASGGTIYADYDGLNRQLWRNSSNSPTGAYASYTYDSTAGGNHGIGRLTGESFTSSLGSGSYSYVYDVRGRSSSITTTVNGSSYPLATTYDDADHITTQTYPTGEVVTSGYTAQGWLTSLTRTLSGTTTTLLSAGAYAGPGGAAGQMTSGSIAVGAGGATYLYSATYDLLARPTQIKLIRNSDSATVYAELPSYDAGGNVSSITTSVPTGTDVQAFCYDDQERLTWSGSTGTPSCGGSFTPGSLTSAYYIQTFGYDNLGRLTSGPIGSYTYGSAAHKHAVTSTSGGYSAAYDAAGNMTCRAPNSTTTCSGTQTGAQLGYDNEGRLASWQNKPSSPTSTTKNLYDNDGQRVAQQITSSGTTTTTVYIGNVEEVSTSGSTTSTYTYYSAAGKRLGEAINGGSVFYLASDHLGTPEATLLSNGTSTAVALYSPYGLPRYASGSMPTDYGFTGQHADQATGLDYYVARYYDATVGQFTAPDTILPGDGKDIWGLSRYAYVEGNPITRADPSGHCWPLCTIGIGLAIGVVAAAVDVGAQMMSNGGDIHKVDWGEAAKIGVTVGVASAVVLTTGFAPAASALSVFAPAAGSAALGAGMGAVEGAVGSWQHGDSPGTALRSALIGGATGEVGGFISGLGGGPLTGGIGNATANILSSYMTDGYVDPKSAILAFGVGAACSSFCRKLAGEDVPGFKTAAIGATSDFVAQAVVKPVAQELLTGNGFGDEAGPNFVEYRHSGRSMY